jgi:uncharacterized protein
MRRTNREIKEQTAIDEIIRSTNTCRLAMSKDNQPYVVPLSFGYDGEDIYFHTATKGQKIDFIEANPNVCVEFDNCTEITKGDKACKWSCHFQSVICFGKIEEITNKDGMINALNILMEQYSGRSDWEYTDKDLKGVRMWCVKIESMTGKQYM